MPLYEDALKRSGFTEKLEYIPKEINNNNNENQKKRKRKIIWFNPPYSKNVKTNIGRIFLKLVKKHFPKDHQLHKVFNKNTVKVSYSCMKNIGSIIASHNKAIINPIGSKESGCNCRVKENCPLDNKCLTSSLIYEATVSNTVDEEKKRYIGLTEGTFKTRFSNHCKDFKQDRYRKSTELSKYVWMLKDEGKNPKINWRIVKKVNSKPRSHYCKLCLTEKFYINRSIGDTDLLNT